MPAVLNQYAAAIGDNDGVSTMPDVFNAKDQQQNYLPQQHATNKNDLMDTSIHSTVCFFKFFFIEYESFELKMSIACKIRSNL